MYIIAINYIERQRTAHEKRYGPILDFENESELNGRSIN